MLRNTCTALAAAALASFLAGCEADPALTRDFDELGQAIVNGDLDGRRHPQVCALGIPSGEAAQPFYEWCSGTLIAPNVILTAAHCISYLDASPELFALCPPDGTADLDQPWLTGEFIPIPGATSDPAGPLLDTAVFVLDEAVPRARLGILPPVGFVGWFYGSRAARQHVLLTNVGFGLRSLDDWETYLPPRMVSHSRVTGVTVDLLESVPAPGGVCFGDSGGPAFLGATPILAGTTWDGDCETYSNPARNDRAEVHAFLAQYVWYLR